MGQVPKEAVNPLFEYSVHSYTVHDRISVPSKHDFVFIWYLCDITGSIMNRDFSIKSGTRSYDAITPTSYTP